MTLDWDAVEPLLEAGGAGGGQGVVRRPTAAGQAWLAARLGAGGPFVVKQYGRGVRIDAATRDELVRRVALVGSLPSASRRALLGDVAFPLAVLVGPSGRGGSPAVRGLVMQDAMPRFQRVLRLPSGRTKTVLLSLEHLALQTDAQVRRRFGFPIDEDARVQLVHAMAAALARLHDRGLVVADLSARNTLVRRTGSGWDVSFIDADSMVRHGVRGVEAAGTPNWESPSEPARTQEDDRYKLGLAVLRIFVGERHDTSAPPPRVMTPELRPAIPARLRPLLTRALSSSPRVRPAAKTWASATADDDRGAEPAWIGVLRTRLALLVALAVSAAALVLPVVVVPALVAGSAGLALRERLDPGAARRRRLPGGRASLIRTRARWTVATVAGCVVAGAGVPALLWLALHGDAGVLAAARLGALRYAVPLAVFVLCLRVLRAPGRPARALTDAVAHVQDRTPAVVLATAGIAVALAGLGAAGLRETTTWPLTSVDRVAAIVPAGDALRDAEDDLVRAQAEAVVRCLARESRDVGWTVDLGRADDGALTLGVTRPDTSVATTRRDVSLLVLALHNQLPSSVRHLVVLRSASYVALDVDRRAVRRRGPERDVKRLADAAGVERPVLPTSDRVVDEALRCGAVHV